MSRITYFEMALRDVGMLPKLEGTEHVNMALIIKFVRNYFFEPVDYPQVPQNSEAADDTYLFQPEDRQSGHHPFSGLPAGLQGC